MNQNSISGLLLDTKARILHKYPSRSSKLVGTSPRFPEIHCPLLFHEDSKHRDSHVYRDQTIFEPPAIPMRITMNNLVRQVYHGIYDTPKNTFLIVNFQKNRPGPINSHPSQSSTCLQHVHHGSPASTVAPHGFTGGLYASSTLLRSRLGVGSG